MKAVCIFKSLEFLSTYEVLLFFHAVHFVNPLQIKKNLDRNCLLKIEIQHCPSCTARYIGMDGGEKKAMIRILGSPIQPNLYYVWNLKRFQVQATQTCGYSPVELQTSLSCLQMPKVIETSQPLEVCNRPEVLNAALQYQTGFMIKTIHKELRNIHM